MERYMQWMLAILMGGLVFFFVVLVAFLTFVLWSEVAKAHSFYEASCCNDRDCAPLPPEQVQVTPQGYVLPNGQTVPFGQERVSPDKDYHWCRYPGTQPLVHPYNERVCFYAPSQGS
jgi:hypothetical protein